MVKVTATDCDICGAQAIDTCVFCRKDVCLQCSQSIFGGMGINRYYCTSHLTATPLLASELQRLFKYQHSDTIRYAWKDLKKFKSGWLIIYDTHEDGMQFGTATSKANAEARLVEYHTGGGDNSETNYSVYHQGKFYDVEFTTTAIIK